MRNVKKLNVFLVLALFLYGFVLLSINTLGNESNFKIGVVIQPKFEASIHLNDSLNNDVKFLNRRLRLIASGNLNEKINYYFQCGFSLNDFNSVNSISGTSNNPVFDAFFDYNFDVSFYVRIGQFKLPGNFSRLISFKNLSFSERSSTENYFKIYRDIGIMTFKSLEINDLTLNGYVALTHGEGVNSNTSNNSGYNYTTRVEILPFGNFDINNKKCEMDKTGEKSLKLMIGGAYNYNDNTYRQFSTTGQKLHLAKNIHSYFFDVLIKYHGLSILAEYLGRRVENNNQLNSDSLAFAGNGYSISASYKLFENNYIAVRFNNSNVDKAIKKFLNYQDVCDISLGFTSFLFENTFKFQFETTFYKDYSEDNDNSELIKLALQFVIMY